MVAVLGAASKNDRKGVSERRSDRGTLDKLQGVTLLRYFLEGEDKTRFDEPLESSDSDESSEELKRHDPPDELAACDVPAESLASVAPSQESASELCISSETAGTPPFLGACAPLPENAGSSEPTPQKGFALGTPAVALPAPPELLGAGVEVGVAVGVGGRAGAQTCVLRGSRGSTIFMHEEETPWRRSSV